MQSSGCDFKLEEVIKLPHPLRRVVQASQIAPNLEVDGDPAQNRYLLPGYHSRWSLDSHCRTQVGFGTCPVAIDNGW